MATYHTITGLSEATDVTLKRGDVAMEELTITYERLELPDQD